jgi:ribosomal protein S18 acetylase RimI-like enzyme
MTPPIEELRIRLYRPEDLDTLRAMTVEAFDGVSIDQNIERSFGLINGRDWTFRKGRHVDDDATRAPEGIFVAELGDGSIAGFISTRMDCDAGIGHIPNLVVRAGLRGKGVGRKLLEFATDRFRAAGLTHARIETLDQNPVGNHLYRSFGFQEVARQVHFCADLRVVEEGLREGETE